MGKNALIKKNENVNFYLIQNLFIFACYVRQTLITCQSLFKLAFLDTHTHTNTHTHTHTNTHTHSSIKRHICSCCCWCSLVCSRKYSNSFSCSVFGNYCEKFLILNFDSPISPIGVMWNIIDIAGIPVTFGHYLPLLNWKR